MAEICVSKGVPIGSDRDPSPTEFQQANTMGCDAFGMGSYFGADLHIATSDSSGLYRLREQRPPPIQRSLAYAQAQGEQRTWAIEQVLDEKAPNLDG